jgi:crotonobetainyl-CoA:carnitine CoA-transferase CaiB-like acyl-CoA transferase
VGPKQYEALCRVLGRPDLISNPLFTTNELRFENRRAWTEAAKDDFLKWRKADLEQALSDAEVPASAVNAYADVFEEPQVKHRGVEVRMESREAEGAVLRLVGNPVRLAATPPSYRTPPPRFGEHTDEVLHEVLGMDEDEIRRLRAIGAI